MRIQAALLARYAEVEPQGGLLNVTGGGIDVFGVRGLPAEFTVALVLQLVFDENEAGTEHELAVLVRGPELEQIGERTAWPITPTLGEFHKAGWRGLYSIAGALTLSVTSEGSHSVEIQIDRAQAGDIPFQVLLANS